MFKFKIFIISILMTSKLIAEYELQDPSFGNIAVEVGVWDASLNGSISNTNTNTDIKNDLGFIDSKNITSFGMDVKNNIFWLPNIHVDYFILNSSSHSDLVNKRIDNDNFNGTTLSEITYSEINTIMYGYLQRGIFDFDLGVNIKKINLEETVKSLSGTSSVIIKGPESILILPYIALNINLDFMNTIIKAESSLLSIGDNEAKDYKLSLTYKVMRNLYLTYGSRYNSFKSQNSNKINNEKNDINLKGNYFNVKLLF